MDGSQQRGVASVHVPHSGALVNYCRACSIAAPVDGPRNAAGCVISNQQMPDGLPWRQKKAVSGAQGRSRTREQRQERFCNRVCCQQQAFTFQQRASVWGAFTWDMYVVARLSWHACSGAMVSSGYLSGWLFLQNLEQMHRLGGNIYALGKFLSRKFQCVCTCNAAQAPSLFHLGSSGPQDSPPGPCKALLFTT